MLLVVPLGVVNSVEQGRVWVSFTVFGFMICYTFDCFVFSVVLMFCCYVMLAGIAFAMVWFDCC